jgi:signal transduction histidine kinase
MNIEDIKNVIGRIRFKAFISLLIVSVIPLGFYFFMSSTSINNTVEYVHEYFNIYDSVELGTLIKSTVYKCRGMTIAITLLIVVLLCIHFERKIVYPVKALEKQITVMGKKNVLGKVYIDGPFEIVNLAKAFNEMSTNLEQRIKENEYLKDRLEHDKIRTEFFSNLSHELRTPLNVLFSTMQLFELYVKKGTIEDRNGKIMENLNAVRQNCFRLMKITNNMIDMTKMNTNYYNIYKKNQNIVNIVRNITKSAAEYVIKKGKIIIFNTNVDQKIIACDTESIERIMLNLLSNAAKFTKPGGKIYVNVIDEGEFVNISVKDNGVGIPESKLSNIFERFIQVDRSLTRQHEGSGIGLSIVNSLVKIHGGKIFVTSKPGEGSEFSVKLPATLVPEEDEENEIVNCKICKGYMDKVAIEFSDIY